MNRILSVSLLLVLSLVGLSTAHAQDKGLRIAVVDMTKVLKDYYKTIEAEKRINDMANGYQKDLGDRREAYGQLVEQIQQLREQIQDKTLNEEKKKERQEALEQKMKDAATREVEIRNFLSSSSRLLQDQRREANDRIMGEVSKAVTKVSKDKNLNLVLIKAEFPSPVLYSDITDISAEVITELNKDKPVEKK